MAWCSGAMSISPPFYFLKSSSHPYSSCTSSTSFFFYHRQQLLIPRSYSATSFINSGNGLDTRSMTHSRSRSNSMYNGASAVFSNRSMVGFMCNAHLVAGDFFHEKQIPPQPHWAFCYDILPKVAGLSYILSLQQFAIDDTRLHNAIHVFALVLRALDTVEDDTSIPTDIRVPILNAFHRHIYDSTWHISCGTDHNKVLMDEFHHVSNAFLELEKGYQEVIEDITKRIGAGMAKFICKEVETVDDYDEYCHYVSGLVVVGLSKLVHPSGLIDLTSDSIYNSVGLFIQKVDTIQDYLEDINEMPKPRMFWPREIWSKYVPKLEDLKYEENSDKAVQCLNEMVTNALEHVEDCLICMHALKEPSVFRSYAIIQTMEFGTLALCYDNIEVFRGGVKMRHGLTAKVITRTKTMADVYGAFFDFSCIIKSKVNKNDPNATKTLSRLDAIQKACRDSGLLNIKRKLHILKKQPAYISTLVVMLLSYWL